MTEVKINAAWLESVAGWRESAWSPDCQLIISDHLPTQLVTTPPDYHRNRQYINNVLLHFISVQGEQKYSYPKCVLKC